MHVKLSRSRNLEVLLAQFSEIFPTNLKPPQSELVGIRTVRLDEMPLYEQYFISFLIVSSLVCP